MHPGTWASKSGMLNDRNVHPKARQDLAVEFRGGIGRTTLGQSICCKDSVLVSEPGHAILPFSPFLLQL